MEDLNKDKRNFPNVDLKLSLEGNDVLVQVKACKLYRWISAGGANSDVCTGGLAKIGQVGSFSIIERKALPHFLVDYPDNLWITQLNVTN